MQLGRGQPHLAGDFADQIAWYLAGSAMGELGDAYVTPIDGYVVEHVVAVFWGCVGFRNQGVPQLIVVHSY